MVVNQNGEFMPSLVPNSSRALLCCREYMLEGNDKIDQYNTLREELGSSYLISCRLVIMLVANKMIGQEQPMIQV